MVYSFSLGIVIVFIACAAVVALIVLLVKPLRAELFPLVWRAGLWGTIFALGSNLAVWLFSLPIKLAGLQRTFELWSLLGPITAAALGCFFRSFYGMYRAEEAAAEPPPNKSLERSRER